MGGLDELFDASEAVTPPLDETALKAVPARRGVFALLAADGAPILVTTAADIRSRLRYRLTAPEEGARRKAADLREITARVCWRLTTSRFETDWRYFEIVRAIWPDGYEDLLPKRRAWFVAVDEAAEVPVFRSVDGFLPTARQMGPFPDRRSADRFIDALVDAFDLCRCTSILRQAPGGTACSYKQMGRCAAWCDGSAPMDAYRRAVADAAAFAAGEREPVRKALIDKMKQAAAETAFERAGALKGRLERLDVFEESRFAHVRDARRFGFVIIQQGPSSRAAASFVCDRGAIAEGPSLAFPPNEAQLADVLDRCDRLRASHTTAEEPADSQRAGLVAFRLFAGTDADGLVLHRDDLTPAALAEAITASADMLKLKAPRRKSPAAGGPNAGAESG